MKLDEQDIKIRFIQEMRVRRIVNRKTLLASEYVLGDNGTRADLAFLSDIFVGVEIKSEFDTLSRLKNQVENYNKCFEKTIIVASHKHLKSEIFKQIDAEVWAVDAEGKFSVFRNKSVGSKAEDVKALASMLSAAKLKKLLSLKKKSAMDRAELISAASLLSRDKIYETVIESFRETYTVTSENFWSSLGRRKVNLSALENLSRFHAVRQAQQKYHMDHILFWENWKNQASEMLIERSALSQSNQLLELASPERSDGTYEYSYAQ